MSEMKPMTIEQADSHAHICSKLAEQYKSDPVLFAALTDAAAIIRDLMRDVLKEAARICKDLDDEALETAQAPRACTCHPDDRPDGPCRERYAASECQALASAAPELLAALKKVAQALEWFAHGRCRAWYADGPPLSTSEAVELAERTIAKALGHDDAALEQEADRG